MRQRFLSIALAFLLVIGIVSACYTKTANVNLPATDSNTIAYNQLPPEAQDVITRIKAHGRFEFKQDGQTFQNRENILPNQPRGYYKEYTVVTPNASNRGARRIIAGQPNEFYYTADHYRSFYRVK